MVLSKLPNTLSLHEVSFMTFSVRDPNDPDKMRIHIHIQHDGSLNYYHQEYPGTSAPEMRWK